jgi:uncharacterized membrane protein (TIGR02234 family)
MTEASTDIARREYLGVLAVAVLAAGVIMLGSSQSWLRLHVDRPAPFAPVTVSITGRSAYPAVFGFAVVAIITVVLVAVTAGWGRRVLGVLLAVNGVSSVWYGVRGLAAPGPVRIQELLGTRGSATFGITGARVQAAWPLITTGAGVLLTVAAIAIVVRGGRWSGGLSRRYDAPAEAAKSEDPWRTLDRGEDPTIADR